MNIKNKAKVFAFCSLITVISHADDSSTSPHIDNRNDIENPEMETDTGKPSAVAKLQSLKNLSDKQNIQAPFVQELDNQYKVRSLFVETQDLPIIDIQLTFNAGSARDQSISRDLAGLANMTARLLPEGTEKYTATQIATTFQRLGARFSVNAYRDMFVIKLRVLSDPEKLEPALNLLLEIINHATFNSTGLNMIWNNTKVGQKQILENPTSMMNIAFYRALYGEHPYAEPITGTQASIRKITTDDLKNFKNTFLVAQNMNIAITGKLNSKQATDISNKIAGSLPQGNKALSLPIVQEKTDFDIHFIPYQSTQAAVMMGQLAISKDDPDKVALDIANQMFGGANFNSMLMQELRVKRGYTYGAYSSLTALQSPGIFSFNYSTEQNQLLESIPVAYRALMNFVKQPINRKQLEETKAGMLRAFPMNYSSNSSINSQISSIGFYGLPANYLTQYQQQLQSTTAKQVQDAIKRHLHADRLTLVIVSKELDPAALKQQLLDEYNNTNHSSAKPTSAGNH